MLTKHSLVSLFIILWSSYSHAQDIEFDPDQTKTVQQIELQINDFINAEINNHVLDPALIDDILKDYTGNSPNAYKKEVIDELKKRQLREMFFLKFPNLKDLYSAIDIRSQCINFNEVTSYSLHSNPISAGFASCNNNAPWTPYAINPLNMNNRNALASVVTPGLDPLLQNYNFTLNRTRSSNTRAIRLNDNPSSAPGGYDITRLDFNLQQLQNKVGVHFSAVLDNPTGHADKQPYIQFELFDDQNNLVDVLCIESHVNNCIFTQVPNSSYLVTDWTCINLDASSIVGQSGTVRITVADCGLSGHAGYVYIDPCFTPCTQSSFGSINLNSIEGICPKFPLEVCGTYEPPMQGTPQEGVLTEIYLKLEGNSSFDFFNPTTLTNNSFCFTLQESDFIDPTGQYEITVVANFSLNCNIQPFNVQLTDQSTDPGPDIDFDNCTSLWPRTYGGIDKEIKRYASDIEVDEDNNVYTVGIIAPGDITNEDPNFISPSFFGYLMKHDQAGNLIWISPLPEYLNNNGGSDAFFRVRLANDKLVVLATNGYLSSYDLDGNEIFREPIFTSCNTDLFTVNETTGAIYIVDDTKSKILHYSPLGIHQSSYSFPNVTSLTFDEALSKLHVSYDENGISKIRYFNVLPNGHISNLNVSNVTTLGAGRVELIGFDNSTGQLIFFYNNVIYKKPYNGFMQILYDFTTNGIINNNYNDIDIYFDNSTKELLISYRGVPQTPGNPTSNVRKINLNGNDLWTAELGNTEDIWIKGVAQRGNQQSFVCGQLFINASMIGGEPIANYPSQLNLFTTRIKYENGGVIYNRGIQKEDNFYYAVPNPVANSLKIKNDKLQERKSNLTYEVLNVHGFLVKHKDQFIPNESNLDLTNLRTGIYFIKIYKDGQWQETLTITKK